MRARRRRELRARGGLRRSRALCAVLGLTRDGVGRSLHLRVALEQLRRRGLRRRRHRLLPQAAVIVAIRRLHEVLARIEGQPALPDIVAEQRSDPAARIGGRDRPIRREERACLVHHRMRIGVCGIEERAADARAQRREGRVVARIRAVEATPQPRQPRQLAQRERFDPRVFEQRHEHDLDRLEPFASEARAAEARVRREVSRGREVERAAERGVAAPATPPAGRSRARSRTGARHSAALRTRPPSGRAARA